MKTTSLVISLVFVAITVVSLAARADADSEREALAKISAEIERLQLVVADASKSGDPTARVKFHYDWLGRDLELMKSGIADHLDAPRQPRPIPPLRGDYRQ
jgi:RAQPRD family integrative conjugative element protein